MDSATVLAILGFLVALPPAILASIKVAGWLKKKKKSDTTPQWEDFVADIESLDGATEVIPREGQYQIALKYSYSERRFHRDTKYDYEVIDFKKPLMMIEPLG
jgi:hypothetical protein